MFRKWKLATFRALLGPIFDHTWALVAESTDGEIDDMIDATGNIFQDTANRFLGEKTAEDLERDQWEKKAQELHGYVRSWPGWKEFQKNTKALVTR